jgi:hypothetical protein
MSIFEQPDIRSNTKTGGMMRKINLTLTGVLAGLAFVFTLGVGPIHAQVRTFTMPACPIKATTVPVTKTDINFPEQNPVGETFSVGGTVQVTDQTSSTVFLTQYAVVADSTGLMYARTVKQLAHETFSVTFDKGCTRSDPYGSNNCAWTWGQSIRQAYSGALQEDITSGKLIVDLKVNNTTPVQFACPVCGATCTITMPEQLNQDQNQQGGNIWDLIAHLSRLPISLTTPLKLVGQLLTAAAPR